MAKVRNPLHCSEASGTINGFTYSQRAGGSVVRRYNRPPPREATPDERERRDIFYDTGQLYRIAERLRQFFHITNPLTGETVIEGPQLIDIFHSQVPENINPFNHWQRVSRINYDRVKITRAPDFFSLPLDEKIAWTASSQRAGLNDESFIGRHTIAKLVPAELAYHLSQIAMLDPDGVRRQNNDGADLQFRILLEQQVSVYRFHNDNTNRLGWWFDDGTTDREIYDRNNPGSTRQTLAQKRNLGVEHQLPRNEYLLTGNAGTETTLGCDVGLPLNQGTHIASARFVAATSGRRLDLITVRNNNGGGQPAKIIFGMTRGGDIFIRNDREMIIARTQNANINMFGEETEIVISARMRENEEQKFTMTMYQRTREEKITATLPAGTIPIEAFNRTLISWGADGFRATENVFDGIVREMMTVYQPPEDNRIDPLTWRARDNIDF